MESRARHETFRLRFHAFYHAGAHGTCPTVFEPTKHLAGETHDWNARPCGPDFVRISKLDGTGRRRCGDRLERDHHDCRHRQVDPDRRARSTWLWCRSRCTMRCKRSTGGSSPITWRSRAPRDHARLRSPPLRMTCSSDFTRHRLRLSTPTYFTLSGRQRSDGRSGPARGAEGRGRHSSAAPCDAGSAAAAVHRRHRSGHVATDRVVPPGRASVVLAHARAVACAPSIR